MSAFTLPARQPFNFASVLTSHGWYQLAPFRYDSNREMLLYAGQLTSGRLLEFSVRPAPAGVRVQTSAALNNSERRELKDQVAWMFGLDQDFASFYRVARGEPKLRQARRKAHGRVLRSPTLFEDVLKTILTTNTLWAATRRMTLNLVEAFGTPVSGGGPTAFPTPQQIAAAGPKLLRDRVRVGYRAESIHELGQRVASGDLDLEALKTSSLPTLELRKELLKIRGVGPYAAANLLMILGRPDFIPIDTYALKMVSHEWHRGRKIGPRHVERAFQKWGAFKGLAFWFWDWSYSGD
jgi:3-methyladenine DNA glycosylase/8-oxoguanine DNA glycosylase